MGIQFLTIILAAFVCVLYAYLILARKSIVIKAKKSKRFFQFILSFSVLLLVLTVTDQQSLDHFIRSVLAVLVLLSFLLDAKGLSEDRLILTPFDVKGVLYQDIDKIVLLVRQEEIRLNYFNHGRRGPMLKFTVPVETLLAFFSNHLSEETQVELLIEED